MNEDKKKEVEWVLANFTKEEVLGEIEDLERRIPLEWEDANDAYSEPCAGAESNYYSIVRGIDEMEERLEAFREAYRLLQ